MINDEQIDWQMVSSSVRSILETHGHLLSEEARHEAQEMLAYDEYEFSLEIMCIEFLERDLMTHELLSQCMTLGELLQFEQQLTHKHDLWDDLLACRAKLNNLIQVNPER